MATSSNPAARHCVANDSACCCVHPWLASPVAPGCDRRSTASSRPFGARTRCASSSPSTDVLPVVHGRQGPQNRGRSVRQRHVLRGALGPLDAVVAGEGAGQPQHHRRRIDAGRTGAAACGFPDRTSRTAPDVDDPVAVGDTGDVGGQAGVGAAHHQQHQPDDRPGHAGEAGVVGVMVDRQYFGSSHVSELAGSSRLEVK